MPKFSNMSNAELAAWVTNFTTVVGAAPTTFGFIAQEITDFVTANTGFQNRMTVRLAAEEAASAAVKAEQMRREIIEKRASFFNSTLKADPDVPDNEKVLAGVEPNKSPTYTSPVSPTDLVANGYDNGTNVLKWDRAGNKTGTQFIIEYRPAAAPDFAILDVVTETTYTHSGVTPGQQCAYRVKAKRAGESSEYSNVAVVYMT